MLPRIMNFASTASLLIVSLSTLLSAAPLEAGTDSLVRRADEFDPPSTIVSKYVRSNMTNDGRPGVFYNVLPSQLSRDQIRAVAASLNAITLYDVYRPDEDRELAPFFQDAGPYQEYNSTGQLREWFRYTSRVFAQNLRNNVAYLIWDKQQPWFNNPATLPRFWTAIWTTDEFNAIIRGQTSIDTVYVVDPATGIPGDQPYWVRGQPPPQYWYAEMSGANSESNETANPHPNGPNPGGQKRDLEHTTSLSVPIDAELDRTVHKRAPYESSIVKRVPDENGIEQDPDQSVFTYGQTVPWVPGTCNFHFQEGYITGDTPTYFNISLFDDQQTNYIGGVIIQRINRGDTYSMPSRLPYLLVIDPSDYPTDDVTFKYAGLTWSSNSDVHTDGASCTTGDYNDQSGVHVRDGDCVFECNQFQ